MLHAVLAMAGASCLAWPAWTTGVGQSMQEHNRSCHVHVRRPWDACRGASVTLCHSDAVTHCRCATLTCCDHAAAKYAVLMYSCCACPTPHRMQHLERSLVEALLPRDVDDARDIILEVRPGTGGDEASLFAGELLAMYRGYAAQQGWRFQVGVAQPRPCGAPGSGILLYMLLQPCLPPVQSVGTA